MYFFICNESRLSISPANFVMDFFFPKNFTLHTLSFGEVGCRNDYVKVSGHSIQGKWSLTDHFCAKGVKSHKKSQLVVEM